ncbi:hypothetical protein [Xanthomarina sp.]|uniref:hypothetical protein n=1 Tax=Xanthomarina sp. TaxID=1931211 RepID=UPI002C2B1253|nr:hypothetical protein [Xanthomarina sp.]HLV38558.1 hypothetical protein [Xanthomarina sp.]
MPKKLILPFGNVTLYSQYMVVIMNEGITVTPKYNSVLEGLVEKYYKNKKLVYITYRLNSYSVDPNVYFKTSQISNILGFAVVTGNEIRLDNTAIEKMFYTKPYQIFESIEDAIVWAKELCAENK